MKLPTSRALVLALCLPVVALASTIVPHSLQDRALDADRVAVVQVTRQWTTQEGDPSRPTLKTYTQVLIGTELKGSGPKETTIVQLGGRSGPWEMHIPGDASFVVGETALVFLRCTRPDRCYLVALGEGRLSLVENDVVYKDLRRGAWVRRPFTEVIQELSPASLAASRPGSTRPVVAP